MNEIRRQLRALLKVTSEGERGEAFRAVMELPPDFAGFRGHFPGSPVMPGVCIVTAVILAAETSARKPLRLKHLKSAKFFSPVVPNECVEIRGTIDTKQIPHLVKGDVVCGDRRISKVALFVEPAKD